MKNTLVFVSIVLAGLLGFAIGKLSNYGEEIKYGKREKQLEVVVEGYQPTCEQLKEVGIHGPIKIKKNLILVKTEKNILLCLAIILIQACHLSHGGGVLTRRA